MPELAVQISAQIDKLQKALKDSKKELQSLEKIAKNTNNKIGKTSVQASKDISKFNRSTANGSAALTSFSRTIQDMPFGIMGVSNNITNLTEQFGYLKRQTGSAKGALNAMLRDLKGFGGITLGISVATSLLLVFGDKLFQTKDKVKALKEEQDKLTQSLDNYVLGLEAVSRANLKGDQNAQKELTKLKLLKEQVNDTALSLDNRRVAINELRKIYPDYFGSLSEERILSGGLEQVYNKLTTSILKRAKATASMNAIVKNSEKLLIFESQLEAKKEAIKKKAVQTENAERLAVQRAGKERTANNFSVERAIQLRRELNKLIREEEQLKTQIKGVEKENIKLEANIETTGGIVPNVDKIRPKVISAYSLLSEEVKKASSVLHTSQQYILEKNKKFQEEFGKSTEIKFQDPTPNFSEYQSQLLQNIIATQQILESGFTNMFMNIGQAIGNAMAGNINLVEGLGSAILGSMGSIMVQLGRQMIITSKAITAMKKALSNIFTGGAAALAAGIGLVAIGSAFQSSARNIANGGGARSNNISSNTGTGNNTRRTGGFSSSYSGSSNQKVVFEIQGRKLVGVLTNELRYNTGLGGNLSLG